MKKIKILRQTRGFGFDDLMQNGIELDTIQNKSALHSFQMILVILYNDYVCSVPFELDKDGKMFLRTAHLDRDLNKIYNKGDKNV